MRPGTWIVDSEEAEAYYNGLDEKTDDWVEVPACGFAIEGIGAVTGITG
ncbi:hypothetical protein Slin15195_G037780 [Septoria linicola]|uniref:Uncharacterized protein n=1 Tax=Septoria linicola TaxID=215465 RepID=A0A9Q9EHW7_9PEZI|nr:hypothetical protein Slin15195_G037780 [Septoria linicola]